MRGMKKISGRIEWGLSKAHFVVRITMFGLVHKSMQYQVASGDRNIIRTLSACSIHTIFVNS